MVYPQTITVEKVLLTLILFVEFIKYFSVMANFLPTHLSNSSLFSFSAYGDLVASIQRFQLQLKKACSSGGLGGLEGRIAAIQSLLLSPQFGRALAVHNKVQSVRSRTTPRPMPNAQTALKDCLDTIGHSQSAYAMELVALLTGKKLN